MISVGVFIILFFIGQYGDLALAGYGTAIRYEQLYLITSFRFEYSGIINGWSKFWS